MHILTGLDQIEAETAAGRLRAAGINAQVIRDNEALLGTAGSTSLGTFSVSIPDSAEDDARRLLRIRKAPVRESTGDAGPFSGTTILLIALVLALGLVAVYSWSTFSR